MKTSKDLDAALRRLAKKYAVDVPDRWILQSTAGAASPQRTTLAPGWALPAGAAESFVPLLHWRSQRRFVELKRLVVGRTVAPVVMCRFSCQTTGEPMGLDAILYREFDLIEWMNDSPIVSVYASVVAGRFANVLVRLQNGVIGSIEAGATLPTGSQPDVLDRHEIIAGRGLASDRAVDTQLPQDSVYVFTAKGVEKYTDTDAELFGLDDEEVSLVRAAYDLASQPDSADALRRQHRRLAALVKTAQESDRVRRRLDTEGAQ